MEPQIFLSGFQPKVRSLRSTPQRCTSLHYINPFPGIAAAPPCTIIDIFDKILKKNKGRLPALRQEFPVPEFSGDLTKEASADVKTWKTWSYEDYYNDAKVVARGFLSLGLDRHAAVNIWGFNSPEWMLSEIGAIFAGGKAAGIYPTDTPAQILYKIQVSLYFI